MIIDCHTHIFESGHGGPFDLAASAADLVREMDASGVDASIVLPLPGMATNEFVYRECARFPGRLFGLYTPEFHEPRETVRKMQQFFEQHAPRGLKIHPRQQHVTVRDSIVREVLCWAAEQGHPVLFDVFPYGDRLDDLALHPLAYHRLAQDMPGLNMVLAHAGGYKVLEAFVAAKSNPRIFLDISFTPVYFKGSSLVGDCAFLCHRLPAGRVLYGSDFPYIRFGESVEAARALLDGMESSVQQAVWHEAAERLFRIS